MERLNAMSDDSNRSMWFGVLVGVFLVSSCSAYEVPRESLPVAGPTIIEVSPWAVVVGSGSTHVVFVRVMDRDKNPVPNQVVFASVEDPSVANIEEKALTDGDGLARFTVTGIGMPYYSEIVFSAGSVSKSIYVWKKGYGPFFWHRRF